MVDIAATMREKCYARAGFTLMEILIAVMILGLLGALVGPALNNVYKNQQKRAAESSLLGVKKSIEMYKNRVLKLPESLKDLIKKPRDEQAAKRWEGPYIEADEVPQDPWGEPFKYKVTPGTNKPYELYSYGPNSKGSPKEEWIDVWKL